MPVVSGRTHICRKWTGSPVLAFISECWMPRPADIRWATPGVMIPEWPAESWWAKAPSSTQVTISMSRWAWAPKPPPAATRSSLLTSSRPWPTLFGS